MTSLSALHEGSGDDPQMAAEPTYAKEIRPKKSMAQIGILSQLAELNYTKLGKSKKTKKNPFMFTF